MRAGFYFSSYSHMPLIQSFPTEILTEIFGELDFLSLYRAASVCRGWHSAVAGHQPFWADLEFYNPDLRRSDMVRLVLERGKGGDLDLRLMFDECRRNAQTMFRIHCFLKIISRHLDRVVWFTIHAPTWIWKIIIHVFQGQTFPKMRVLDFKAHDIWEHWQLPYAADSGEGLEVVVPPPSLVFPLPHDHMLEAGEVQGICLGSARLPNLYRFQIQRHLPDIRLDDDPARYHQPGYELNPWLHTWVASLLISGVCCPVVEDSVNIIIGPDDVPAPPKLQHLYLQNISATTTPDNTIEFDCTPFFSALDTSRLRTLGLDTFDCDSRAWGDFVRSTMIGSTPKFPCLEELLIRRQNFDGYSYGNIRRFLTAFPRLRRLVVKDCFKDIGGTWDDLMDTLEMFPGLCVDLKQLEVDDMEGDNMVVVRHDPLPLRLHMLYFSLPMVDCY
ncbi:hypothetical protein R3P38DRAFT_3260186 [Favolaschia claudopus]|uniref:F-box domain-containing protein n=1 Tax=Favolaschia claudopus TaxID=2862362 RepID=A0AAW0CSW5_9AGAR